MGMRIKRSAISCEYLVKRLVILVSFACHRTVMLRCSHDLIPGPGAEIKELDV